MEKDINRRKIIEIDAFKTLNKIVDSTKISNTVKIRTFKCRCCQCIPLQQRTVDTRQKNGKLVDIFQRTYLRKILGVHWAKSIANVALYTKSDGWSTTIPRGTTLQLARPPTSDSIQPPRLALIVCLTKVNKLQTIEQLTRMAHGRNNCRNIVRRVVLQT